MFGPDWVETDREARIAGHATYAPRAFWLPQRGDALRAYAAGVNAWQRANRRRRPPFQPLEFNLTLDAAVACSPRAASCLGSLTAGGRYLVPRVGRPSRRDRAAVNRA